MKSASSLAAWGCRVTVVGASASGRSEELQAGSVRVLREPPTVREGGLSRSLRVVAFRSETARSSAVRCRGRRERHGVLLIGRLAERSRSGGPGSLARRAALRGLRVADQLDRRWLSLRSRATDGTLADLLVRLTGTLRFTDPVAREFPQLGWLERGMAARLDALAPDVLHAHDFTALPIVAAAADRAQAAGRRVPWIYDAHEYVRGLTTFKPGRLEAAIQLERRHVHAADRVITVSEPLGRRLVTDHGLARTPDVVLNAPRLAAFAPGSGPGLRETLGLPAGVALAVYPGNVKPARGLDAVVDALALLPELHLVLLTESAGPYLAGLVERAARSAGAGRLHVLPYVEPQRVSTFIADATFGINPLLRYPNSEVALPNKIFEYIQARLPIVATALPAVEALVRPLGIGETYSPGDPSGFAAATRRVLVDLPRYRAAYDRHPDLRARCSWEAQEHVLHRLYSELLP